MVVKKFQRHGYDQRTVLEEFRNAAEERIKAMG